MKEQIRKYTINLNQRLIAYNYNVLDKASIEQKRKFLIPINAFNIELIVDYTKQDNRKNEVISAKDPIIEAIERGLTPDKLTSTTFKVYGDYFPKVKPIELPPEKKEKSRKKQDDIISKK